MNINDIQQKQDLIQVSDSVHQFSAEEFNAIVDYIKTLGNVVFAEPHDYFDIISGMEEQSTNVFVNTAQSEAILQFVPRYRRSQSDASGNPIITNVSGNSTATVVVKDSNLNIENTITTVAVYNVTNQVNIPQLLIAGTHYVDISITPTGQETQTLQFVVTSTSLGISFAENVKWHLPWKQYTKYEIGPYIITGSLDKTFHIRTKCGSYVKEDSVNLGTDSYVEIPYVYEATSKLFPGQTGQVEIEAWLTAGQIETTHIKYNVAGISSGQNNSATIVVLNNPISAVPIGQNANLFQYCIYNRGQAVATINFTENITDDDDVVYSNSSSSEVQCETKFTYSKLIEIDSDSPNLEAQFGLYFTNDVGTDITIPVDNSLAMPYTPGASFVMNPSKKNNGDKEQSIQNAAGSGQWTYSFENMLFNDNVDGWTMIGGRSALVVPAKSSIVFSKNMFRNVNTNSAKVVDITYKVSNVQDYDEPVITMCDDYTKQNFVGLKITPSRILLHSNFKNDPSNDYMQGTNVPDEQTINVQICLCPNYNTNYGNFAFIYVNGVKKVTFTYTGDSFSTNSGVIKIGSTGADTYIYSIKEYNTSFSFSNVLTNFYSSLDGNVVNRQQYKQFDDNVIDSTASGVTVAYEKMVQLTGADARNYFVISLDNESDLPKYGKDKSYSHLCDFEMHYQNGYAFRLNNQKIEGQGTTSMNYYLWNFRWRIDKNAGKKCGVQYSTDGGTTWTTEEQAGDVTFFSDGQNDVRSGVKRITAKKNYASSMQSHKIGSTGAYNDLHDAVVGNNSANARVAVYQYPAYGFIKVPTETPGRYIYKFVGLYTIGPDKGDKHTFGYDNSTYKNTYALLEGLDHNTALTLFKYPWNSQVGAYAHDGDLDIAINASGGNYQRGWEVSALCGLETDNTKEGYNQQDINDALEECWKPAYEVAYLNSPFIKSLSETGYNSISDINTNYETFSASVDENDRPLSHFEIYDNNYNLYYYDLKQKEYVTSGVNVAQDLGITTQQLSGLTASQKTDMFIRARVNRFKQNVGKYWNVNDCLFHQQFCFIIAATDNDAKNTYPYSFDPQITNGQANIKWGWKQDDLDTIFDIDNQGVPMKKYSVERSDYTQSNGTTTYMFKGEDSVFWTLMTLAYDTYDENKTADVIGRSILQQMCNLSSGITYEEKLMNFFKKYYWDNAQNYFSRSAYNVDAKISYEDASANTSYTSNVDIDPLKQSLGNHEEAEKDWVNKRIIYCMSKYKFGPFGNYENSEAGKIQFRTQTAQSFTLTPTIDLYPTVISGNNSDIRKPDHRITAGDSFVTGPMGGNNTQITIPAADYLEDVGDLSRLSVDSNADVKFSVKSKHLKRIKIGDQNSQNVTATISQLDINECPQLKQIDARNLISLQGVVDISLSPKIEQCLLQGTNITQFVANNVVNLEYLSLPSTVARLTITNAPKLIENNIQLGDISGLQYIRIENSNVDVLDEVFSGACGYAQDIKNRGIRIINTIGTVKRSSIDVSLLQTIYTFRNVASEDSVTRNFHGIDSEGVENRMMFPVITGTAIVDNEGNKETGTLYPGDIKTIQQLFPNLQFDGDVALYDLSSTSVIYQYICKYLNNGSSDPLPIYKQDLYNATGLDFGEDFVIEEGKIGYKSGIFYDQYYVSPNTDTERNFDNFKYFKKAICFDNSWTQQWMTSITLPSTIKYIDGQWCSRLNDGNLAHIYIDEDNETFTGAVSVHDKDGNVLGSLKGYHIAEKQSGKVRCGVGSWVTSGDGIIEPCSHILNNTDVVIDSNVTTLHPSCIRVKNGISSIFLPKSLGTIASSALTGNLITDLVICLRETPPTIIQNRYTRRFGDDKGPMLANYERNIQRDAFLGNVDFVIYVPTGCAEAYKNDSSWSYYADYICEYGGIPDAWQPGTSQYHILEQNSKEDILNLIDSAYSL